MRCSEKRIRKAEAARRPPKHPGIVGIAGFAPALFVASDDSFPPPKRVSMIVWLLWGLFETTARLEDAQDRAAAHQLALLMVESLNLDSRIME